MKNEKIKKIVEKKYSEIAQKSKESDKSTCCRSNNIDIAKSIGETMHYEPYLALYNVRGTVNTWSPSINDALARDWKVIE